QARAETGKCRGGGRRKDQDGLRRRGRHLTDRPTINPRGQDSSEEAPVESPVAGKPGSITDSRREHGRLYGAVHGGGYRRRRPSPKTARPSRGCARLSAAKP